MTRKGKRFLRGLMAPPLSGEEKEGAGNNLKREPRGIGSRGGRTSIQGKRNRGREEDNASTAGYRKTSSNPVPSDTNQLERGKKTGGDFRKGL